MSNSILLNWAIMAVSFFNTILLLWLGATVLLNAERRDWGIGLATGGLLLGGAFFVSHTAILGLFIGGHLVSGYTAIISEGLLVIGRNMIFWWTTGLSSRHRLALRLVPHHALVRRLLESREEHRATRRRHRDSQRSNQEVAQRNSPRSPRPLRLNLLPSTNGSAICFGWWLVCW